MIKKATRTKRSLDNLRKTLIEDLALLKEHCLRLEAGDNKYYKEVMTKLRLLLYKSPNPKTTKPLLFLLSDKYQIKLTVFRKEYEQQLEEYLEENLFTTPLPATQKSIPNENYLTRNEFIFKAASQDGGAHEDEEIENDLLMFKGEKKDDPFFGIKIDGQHPHIRQTILIAKDIYDCGIKFINKIDSAFGEN